MSQVRRSKSLFGGASWIYQALHIISAVAMIGLSIYLTDHYFEAWFPKGLKAVGLCEISSSVNCEITTLSPMSNLLGVPISLFGLLIGLFLLAGHLFQSAAMEKTNRFILFLNAIGCSFLCAYSLFALHGFCPMCVAYYVASGLAFLVYMKTGSLSWPDWKVLAIYALVVGVASAGILLFVSNKKHQMERDAGKIITLYDALAKVGAPTVEAPYFVAKATENFADAPLRIVKFSDFQCPSCNKMSKSLHKIARKYRDQVNIQYMFYPLDHNCNPNLTRSFHPHACQAAYLAACLPERFAEVETDIFDNQSGLSAEWIANYAKEAGVSDCYTSPETKKKVGAIIAAAEPFNIQGTPTLLINERKIRSGRLSLRQLYLILDKLIERHEGSGE